MTPLRLGTTTWLMSPPGVTMLPPARRRDGAAVRPRMAVLGRIVLLAAATAAFGFTTIASAPGAHQVPLDGPVPAGVPVPSDGAIAPRMATAEPSIALQRSDTAFFQRSALGPAVTFTMAEPGFSANTFAAPAARTSEWREEEFASVTAADGRTLVAGDLRIQLVGLDLPMPDQVCRTLDGRLEYCTVRAATQLELLTRWKRVTCHYRLEHAGQAIGRCRTGTSDLSERMVKSGYAWGAAGAQRG